MEINLAGFRINEFRISLIIIALFVFWITEQLHILRIIAGSIYILFIPGYCITLALFTKKELNNLERFILAIGLSIAVVPIVILFTNIWLGLLIRITTIFLYIATVSLLSLFIYYYRRQKQLHGTSSLALGLVSVLAIIYLSDLHVRIRYILTAIAIVATAIGLWKHKNIFSKIYFQKNKSETKDNSESEKKVQRKTRKLKKSAKLKVRTE